MKQNFTFLRTAVWSATLLMLPILARSELPAPDNLIYGSITVNGQPLTAVRTNFVIEASRAAGGTPVASYRMGANATLGNQYLLTLPVEEFAASSAPRSSVVGDTLYITIRSNASVLATGQTLLHVIPERGNVRQLDIAVGTAGTNPDTDGDGLPDAWELYHFGNLAPTPGSVTTNGQTVLQNFIAGTDPNNPQGGFKLYVNVTNDLKRVWFVAARAEGPGYEGLTRLYTLEFKPVLTEGSWIGVPGYMDVAGSNQTVNYFNATLGAPGFYRGRISLLGLSTGGGDTDGDGLPDNWETLHFGNLSRNSSYVGVNGLTALQNYTAGTDPNDPNSAFKLSITLSNNQQWVSFFAPRAEGAGYEGKNRFFSLELSTNPSGLFTGVANYTNILGNNQTVLYPSAPGSNAFFRGRVSLQEP